MACPHDGKNPEELRAYTAKLLAEVLAQPMAVMRALTSREG